MTGGIPGLVLNPRRRDPSSHADGPSQYGQAPLLLPRGWTFPIWAGVGEWETKFDQDGFWGTPFVWTKLHNFGGTDGLRGNMTAAALIPSQALQAKTSVSGTGFTSEGIDQNPAYYELLLDNHFTGGRARRELNPPLPRLLTTKTTHYTYHLRGRSNPGATLSYSIPRPRLEWDRECDPDQNAHDLTLRSHFRDPTPEIPHPHDPIPAIPPHAIWIQA